MSQYIGGLGVSQRRHRNTSWAHVLESMVPIQFLAVHRRGYTCPPLSHAMPYLPTPILHARDGDLGQQKTEIF
uniref:Uncharacterized protein n=1 Tax=Magallana gigas TaxID=29159 RepID=K1QNW2_MAGGI